MLTRDTLIIDALIIALAATIGLLLAHLGSAARAAATDAERRRRDAALAKSPVAKLMDPLVVGFGSLVRRLGFEGHRARVAKLLVQSGNPWGYAPEEFTGWCVAWAVLVFAVAVPLWSALTGELTIAQPIALSILTYVICASTLKAEVRRRCVAIDRKMPFFLDILSLTMGAGAAFLESCQTAIGGPSPGPLEEEFGLMLREVGAGTQLRDALSNLAKRTPSEEIASFVSAVVQGEELGTPLVKIFETQSAMNRFRRSKAAEQAAARIPNRMAVPTVVLMLAVLILLFGPIIVKAARGEMF